MIGVPRYDDMFGEVRSAISGGTQWATYSIRTGTGDDTGFLLGWLRDNSTDFFQLKIQVPHRRQLGSILASIHLHYMIGAVAPTEGQTAVFTYAYTWLKVGDVVPVIGSWVTTGSPVTLTFGAGVNAWQYGLFRFAANITPPANEGYGGMLLFKVTRGDGSWGGDLGVLDCDAHSLMDRLGSLYEASDSP